jgi:DNA (cytosine-5)-methyltransferase 1
MPTRIIPGQSFRATVRPKAIDLFAGPGGLSLGLKQAGFDIIAAVEVDADAGATYRHNIGNHTEIEDITKFSPKKLRKKLERSGALAQGDRISLIAGGPPCPGFSLIGRSKIMDLIKKGEYGESKDPRHAFIDDPRNKLFLEFVKYVKEFKPDYFIMENVSGMSSYKIENDPIVDVIKRKFGRQYEVEERILNASDYGVPQDRKRIIFMGHRKQASPCSFPSPQNHSPALTALDAIEDLIEVPPTVDGVAKAWDKGSTQPGLRFRRLMRGWEVEREDGSTKKSINGIKTSHWTRPVNDRDRVLFRYIKSGAPALSRGGLAFPKSQPRQIYGDVFPSMWKSDLKPAFEKAGLRAWRYGRYHVEAPSGKRWKMYEQAGFKDKMRRIRWDQPSPTIVAHLAKDGYMFIHPFFDRTITVREAARLQSFPDSFQFLGSMASQFRQVGNAVPPVLARHLGEQIMRALSAE